MKPLKLLPLFALLLGLSPLAHADKTITFNVPVKLEKLDPQVTGVLVYCYVHGNAANQSFNIPKGSNTSPVVNGAFNGNLSVAINVPTADMGKVDHWSCVLRLAGPGSIGSGINSPGHPWTTVVAGATATVSGKF